LEIHASRVDVLDGERLGKQAVKEFDGQYQKVYTSRFYEADKDGKNE
jgi:hypothetical protein